MAMIVQRKYILLYVPLMSDLTQFRCWYIFSTSTMDMKGLGEMIISLPSIVLVGWWKLRKGGVCEDTKLIGNRRVTQNSVV